MRMPLRIVHVVDKFGVRGSSIHGISRLLAWWLPRFDSRRYALRLIGLRGGDAAEAHLKEQGLEIVSLNKGKFDLSTLPALIRLIREARADIVHLHGYGASNFGRLAARATGAKAVVHEHFVDPAMPGYQLLPDALLARWTDWGIAVSESVKTFMVAQRRMPASRVQVIYNGAPLREFKPVNGPVAAQERLRWKIPDGAAVLTAVGRLDEQKGNRYLLDASASLIRAGHRIKVLLVGDGPLQGALQAQCRALGIEQDVIFTGFQANIPLLQSITTIQVFPSLWEGTPLTLFEAMAMRRPIVSTTVDGLGEVLRHGETGLLVPPRDPGALARAIGELLAQPPKAEQLAERALQESRRFDIQRTVDEIQAVYDRLAGGAT